jgi:hypothetical protein
MQLRRFSKQPSSLQNQTARILCEFIKTNPIPLLNELQSFANKKQIEHNKGIHEQLLSFLLKKLKFTC